VVVAVAGSEYPKATIGEHQKDRGKKEEEKKQETKKEI
jgi:ribosomal protein L12E/L44/L45/RPP1/RPP2